VRHRNPNCDGSGPHSHDSQVRVLPYGGGNLILCRACFDHEIAYRKERNRELSKDEQHDLPAWDSITTYPN